MGTLPFRLTRQGAAIFTAAQWSGASVYTFRPIPLGHLVVGGKRLIWMWSTDHAGTGLIGWGLGDKPDASDLVVQGDFGTTLNGETPWLVHNPADTSTPLWVYWHKGASGGQATYLSKTSDFASWTHVGVVMPLTGGGDHTGYARVYRRSATDWVAYHLFTSGSEGRVKRSTSTDGVTWTYGDDFPLETGTPNARRFSPINSDPVIIGAQPWLVGRLSDGNPAGGELQLGDVACIKTTGGQLGTGFDAGTGRTFIRPSATVEHSSDFRTVTTFIDGARLYVYYHVGKDRVYLATAGLPSAGSRRAVQRWRGAA